VKKILYKPNQKCKQKFVTFESYHAEMECTKRRAAPSA